jgi:hypothetical protein
MAATPSSTDPPLKNHPARENRSLRGGRSQRRTRRRSVEVREDDERIVMLAADGFRALSCFASSFVSSSTLHPPGSYTPAPFPRFSSQSSRRDPMIRPSHLAALAFVCACTNIPASQQPTMQDKAEESSVERDIVVRKADIGPLVTLYDSITIDVDGDGTAERVELGVNAGLDDRGEMNWDIHNEWSVIVRDGPDSYPVLHETISGAAAFWVIAADATDPAAILVQTSGLTTSSGGTRLEKFVFDRSRGGYVRTGVVDGQGHRAFYRGPRGFANLLPATSWRGEPN